MRHRAVRLGAIALGPAVAAVILCASSSATAQERVPFGDWHQQTRPRKTDRTTQRFALEIRFGAYYPQVDTAFGGYGPYQRVFGDSAQFYFGVELDWQALRIPFLGVIGPGLGWGFTQTSTLAKITGTQNDSGETTSLTIMPWHLSAVLRADELMRRTGIPIVPYAKLGLAMGMWSAANSEGVSYYPSQLVDPANAVRGRGITWGEHFALGGMFCLNWLDPKSAASLDQNSGVNHAYVFGEWMDVMLNGIGSRPQMHIGSSSWVAGIALDF